MTLKERLTEDFKQAMKDRDTIAKNTLSLARAAIKQVEVDTRAELGDEEIIPILAKQVKMRKDALQEFEAAGRTDLADAYKAEIEVLSAYLPKQMSEEEIKGIVATVAADLDIQGGKQNMGKLMGAVMPKVKGVADGNTVRTIIEQFLA
ncbi:MAG: GatB/YqeY domain-containing protein [Anaerovoracaceae bacterium]